MKMYENYELLRNKNIKEKCKKLDQESTTKMGCGVFVPTLDVALLSSSGGNSARL